MPLLPYFRYSTPFIYRYMVNCIIYYILCQPIRNFIIIFLYLNSCIRYVDISVLRGDCRGRYAPSQ